MVPSSLPDIEPRIYGPQRIAAIVDTLAKDGVAPQQVLAGSDLDQTMLTLASTRVSYAQTATVFHNAQQLSPDPTFALKAGALMHVTKYGTYGYALLSSRTYAEMLEFSVKYRRVIGPLTGMSYQYDRAPGICSFEALLSPDPSNPLYRLALEFTYAARLTLSRDVFGAAFNFTSVRLVYPAPPHADEYQQLFQCPVLFDQSVNELECDVAWTNKEPSLKDGVTHDLARESCQQFIDEIAHCGGAASKVRRALVERMPWRYPSLETMAFDLAIEPRTLRRKLEAQGTSYRQILADVRRNLAINYLRKTRMTTDEIASRLGYSDAANFRHAFVRWTGKTPHEYRENHRISAFQAERWPSELWGTDGGYLRPAKPSFSC